MTIKLNIILILMTGFWIATQIVKYLIKVNDGFIRLTTEKSLKEYELLKNIVFDHFQVNYETFARISIFFSKSCFIERLKIYVKYWSITTRTGKMIK